MKGIKFSEEIIINRPQEVVFAFTQDYQARLLWDGFLKKASLLHGATAAGVDVEAHCVAKNGIGMVTRYVTYHPPKTTAIKMTKGPWLFQSFAGSWTFKAQSQSQTLVVFVYHFSLRFPFALFGKFIRKNLQGNVQQRLKDLKHHLEKTRT